MSPVTQASRIEYRRAVPQIAKRVAGDEFDWCGDRSPSSSMAHDFCAMASNSKLTPSLIRLGAGLLFGHLSGFRSFLPK